MLLFQLWAFLGNRLNNNLSFVEAISRQKFLSQLTEKKVFLKKFFFIAASIEK